MYNLVGKWLSYITLVNLSIFGYNLVGTWLSISCVFKASLLGYIESLEINQPNDEMLLNILTKLLVEKQFTWSILRGFEPL